MLPVARAINEGEGARLGLAAELFEQRLTVRPAQLLPVAQLETVPSLRLASIPGNQLRRGRQIEEPVHVGAFTLDAPRPVTLDQDAPPVAVLRRVVCPLGSNLRRLQCSAAGARIEGRG